MATEYVSNPSSTKQINDDKRVSGDQLVRDIGIFSHQMEWKTFFREVWNNETSRVNSIITEPPAAPTRSII